MKDAFGGSFILKIMLVFFMVFICFMTIAVSFAKTFRVKSNVINILERNKNSTEDQTIADIETYLQSVSYYYPAVKYDEVKKHCVDKMNGELTERGVCLISIDASTGVYYKVYAYIVMEFPLFNAGTVVPIGGETKIIKYKKPI